MNDPARQPDHTDSDFVEQLVFQCLESEDVEAAAEELCARYPDSAPRLRRVLGRLQSEGLVEGDQDRTQSPLFAADADIEIPERLGDFRMISRLGAGGMGVVYLAADEKLGRQVAVKIVRPEQLYFPGARARFQREIEAIARLQHPGIVTIHTVGEENGVPYFSMDYVRGISLARLIANLTGQSPARLRERDLHAQVAGSDSDSGSSADGTWNRLVVKIVRDVALALEHAHVQGVVHRDVKPSNILIGEDLRPRLLDFGLARTEDAQQLTRSTSQLGSLPYMPPEQLEGRADTQAPTLDVYALGVTMYELLTLRSPFLGATVEETRANILAASPRAPRADNSSISVDLETVCRTAMDPTPVRRYQSMAAFVTDLDNLLARRPIVARPVGRALRAWRWCQRHPTATVGLGMAAMMFVFAIGFAVVQLRNIRAAEDTNYLLGIMAAASQLEHGRTLEANASLELCPEHLRRFEWHHLRLRANASDAEYLGHEGRVRWIDVHPGGEEFVSGSEDGTLRLWRISDPAPTLTIPFSETKKRVSVYCCVYSADGEHIYASASDGTIRRFSRDGSDEALISTAERSTVRRLAVEPEGTRLACGYGNGMVQILDGRTGAVLADIEMSAGAPSEKDARPTEALAFSPDGAKLYAAQLVDIAIIDVESGKQVATLSHDPKDFVSTIVPSPDGKRLLSGGTFGRVRVWDLATHECKLGDEAKELGINTGFFHEATNRVFIAGSLGPILVYGAKSLSPRYKLLGHEGTVTRMVLAPDGRTILTSSYDGSIRRWDVDSSPAMQVLGRHKGIIRTLEVTPDGRHAITGGRDGKLTMWDLETRTRRELSPNPGAGIRSTSLSPDGRRLVVVADGLFVVDLAEDGSSRTIPTPEPLWHVTWMPDGARFIGGTMRANLHLFDAKTGEVQAKSLSVVESDDTWLSSLVTCPWTDRIVFGTTNGELFVLDADTLEIVQRIQAHDRTVKALALDTKNRVVISADVHGHLRFWDPETGQRVEGDALWKDEVISSIALSADNERMITSAMGRQIQIWERRTKRRLTVLSGHYMGVMKAQFTPDSRRILSVSMDGALFLWDSVGRAK